jgi:hypothetical protein
MVERGVNDRILSQYFQKSVTRCVGRKELSKSHSSLTIKDLLTAYIIIFFGTLFSTAILVAEISLINVNGSRFCLNRKKSPYILNNVIVSYALMLFHACIVFEFNLEKSFKRYDDICLILQKN